MPATTITTTGAFSFTVPAGFHLVQVAAWGGGQGGQSSGSGTNDRGTGGNSSDYIRIDVVAVAGTTYNGSVGAGGGSSQLAGSDTTITELSATARGGASGSSSSGYTVLTAQTGGSSGSGSNGGSGGTNTSIPGCIGGSGGGKGESGNSGTNGGGGGGAGGKGPNPGGTGGGGGVIFYYMPNTGLLKFLSEK